MESQINLLTLPKDIIKIILSFISIEFTTNLKRTCKYFNNDKLYNIETITGSSSFKNIYRLRDGKKEGISVILYPKGRLYISETFRYGIRDGNYREYYPDGRLRIQTQYKNGEICGRYKLFNEKGQYIRHCIFNDDETCKKYIDKRPIHPEPDIADELLKKNRRKLKQ